MIAAFRTAYECILNFCEDRTCAMPDCRRKIDRPRGRYICAACFEHLPWYDQGSACSICGTRITSEVTHDFVCETCRKNPPAFEKAVSGLVYRNAICDLIQNFKYQKALYLKEDFTDILEGALSQTSLTAQVDVVMPVPLHTARFAERGYNQAALLAKNLAHRINRRYDEKSLLRRYDTKHQARSSAQERRQNLKSAFACVRPEFVRGRTILLVDDVMTTGSTLSACAQPLIQAGAHRIWCVTIARSLPK